MIKQSYVSYSLLQSSGQLVCETANAKYFTLCGKVYRATYGGGIGGFVGTNGWQVAECSVDPSCPKEAARLANEVIENYG